MFGTQWTGERARERLEGAFRSIRTAGVYSPSVNDFRAITGPIDGLELVQAAHHFLGRREPDTMKLLTYCRVIAIEMGWDRKTARRRANDASTRLAQALNGRLGKPHT
jgi:hypothetical protein